jgi:Family of unknown function (DUF6088)
MLYFLTDFTAGATMTIHHQIQTHLQSLSAGTVFTPKSLLSFGSRACIDQVLHRLLAKGIIQREARGVYSKPVISRLTQQPVPSPMPKVLETIAQATAETIAFTGAVAVNYFQLSTQNQLRPIYLTTGRSRTVKIGHQSVVLKHVSPKKLPLGNSKAGLALTALRYVGKKHLSVKSVRQVKSKLEPSEWAEVKRVLATQPAWMIRVVLAAEAEVRHG